MRKKYYKSSQYCHNFVVTPSRSSLIKGMKVFTIDDKSRVSITASSDTLEFSDLFVSIHSLTKIEKSYITQSIENGSLISCKVCKC